MQTPLKHPLQKEIVVVQSKGMERWVSLELARLHGICANVRFPFPSRFIADVFHAVVPEAPEEENPYDPEVMTWEIMRLLPPCSKMTDSNFSNVISMDPATTCACSSYRRALPPRSIITSSFAPT